MKNILYDIYRRNLVPVYRFANEGFVNYTQRDYTIKDNKKESIEGCFVSMCGQLDRGYLEYTREGKFIDRSHDDLYIGAIPRSSNIIYRGLNSNYYYRVLEGIDRVCFEGEDNLAVFYTNAGKCFDYLIEENIDKFEYLYSNKVSKYPKLEYLIAKDICDYCIDTEDTQCIVNSNDIVEVYKIKNEDIPNLINVRLSNKALGFFDIVSLKSMQYFDSLHISMRLREIYKQLDKSLDRGLGNYDELFKEYLNIIYKECTYKYKIEKL